MKYTPENPPWSCELGCGVRVRKEQQDAEKAMLPLGWGNQTGLQGERRITVLPLGEIIFYEICLWQQKGVKREGFGICLLRRKSQPHSFPAV